MKTSMVLSLADGQLEYVARMDSLEKGLRCLKAHGFDSFELAIRDPLAINPEEIQALVAEFQLDLCAIGTGQGYVIDGLSFSDPDSAVRKKAGERLLNHIELARVLQTSVIIASMMGKVNRDTTREQALDWAAETLIEPVTAAQRFGVPILLEPLNRYETNLINSVADFHLFNKRFEDNLRLLFDTFHMNIEAACMTSSLLEVKDVLGHVHLADSNRLAPGMGHIGFSEIIHTLKQIGYQGYLSVEVLPIPTVEKSIEIAGNTLCALSTLWRY